MHVIKNRLYKLFLCSRSRNIVSKQSIADEFNNFFVGVGSNLAKKITVADNAASIYDYMGQQCPNSMFINPVNEDEVFNIIKSCKPKHSQDCDDINMYILSKVTDQIVKPLVHIQSFILLWHIS